MKNKTYSLAEIRKAVDTETARLLNVQKSTPRDSNAETLIIAGMNQVLVALARPKAKNSPVDDDERSYGPHKSNRPWKADRR